MCIKINSTNYADRTEIWKWEYLSWHKKKKKKGKRIRGTRLEMIAKIIMRKVKKKMERGEQNGVFWLLYKWKGKCLIIIMAYAGNNEEVVRKKWQLR